jgi:hypothetical protein
MASNTIAWHQEGQRNARIYLEQIEKRLIEEQERLKYDKERWAFKELQIQEAIKQGKETFNDERFLIKKVKQ